MVNYAYDLAGRVNQVTNYADTIDYAPHGAVNSLALHNGVTEATAFNSRLQAQSITATKSGANLLQLAYSYCADPTNCLANTNNGNISRQTITANVAGWGATQDFTYDALNRLKTAQEGTGANAWQQVYVYDRFGNRAIVTGAYPPTYLPHDSQTPQVATDDPAAMASHFPNNRSDKCSSYDTAGNAQTCDGFTSSNWTYDAENRLSAAGNATFSYDGNGRRVKKTASGVVTTYVYSAMGDLVAEYGAANSNAGTQYLTVDQLGSTRLVTDAHGVVNSRHDYLPFGEEIADASIGARSSVAGYGSSDDIKQKFTGKELDAETGLDYFGARYLSSAQGRWMSPDWSATPQAVPYADLKNPQTLNLYEYVKNNPLRTADIDGHGLWKKFVNWFNGEGCFCEGKELEAVQEKKRARAAAANPEMQQAVLVQMSIVFFVFDPNGPIVDGGGGGAVASEAIAPGEAGEVIVAGEVAAGEAVAASSANGVRLGKSLARQQQVGEMLTGELEVIAGPGARVPLRDAPRLANQCGGAPQDWVKVSSSNYKAPDGTSFEVHAYKNVQTGQVVELKTKLQ